MGEYALEALMAAWRVTVASLTVLALAVGYQQIGFSQVSDAIALQGYLDAGAVLLDGLEHSP